MKNTDRARFLKKKCFGQILAKKWPKRAKNEIFGTLKEDFALLFSGNGLKRKNKSYLTI